MGMSAAAAAAAACDYKINNSQSKLKHAHAHRQSCMLRCVPKDRWWRLQSPRNSHCPSASIDSAPLMRTYIVFEAYTHTYTHTHLAGRAMNLLLARTQNRAGTD